MPIDRQAAARHCLGRSGHPGTSHGHTVGCRHLGLADASVRIAAGHANTPGDTGGPRGVCDAAGAGVLCTWAWYAGTCERHRECVLSIGVLVRMYLCASTHATFGLFEACLTLADLHVSTPLYSYVRLV